MIYSFINSTPFVVLFYIVVLLIIFLNRKKFKWEGVIGVYQTKKGLKTIHRFGKKYSKPIRIIARIGSFIAIIGMIAMTIYLFKGLIDIISNPSAPPVVTPLLPGVKIPGSNLRIPLIESFIAIIVAVIIHEFSHGVVARSHGLRSKSTGFALLAVIPAAFVEIDEEKIEKLKRWKQIDIFAAGPWSNILLTIFIALIILCFSFVISLLMPPTGFTIISVENNSPAMFANISVGDTYFMINNVSIYNQEDFFKALSSIKPNDSVVFKGIDSNGLNKTVIVHPIEKDGKSFIGIMVRFRFLNDTSWWAEILEFLMSVLYWIAIISLGLGLANLLPIGIVDGGRIFKALTMGFDKKLLLYKLISWIVGILLLLNLLIPLFR